MRASEVRDRLRDPGLPTRVGELGFRGDDVADVLSAAAAVGEREDDQALVAILASRVARQLGDFRSTESVDWSGPEAQSGVVPGGVLPMLTLIITAPGVAGFHASRDVPPDISTATLADLGRQVGVHRLTYGQFGLHTQDWLTLVWSGALYQLGRLQFNLQLDVDDHWVLSTHIPASGPLTPASVDASFAAASRFFAAHFPDYPTTDFFCDSWLLDPLLSELLPDSNLAAFQRRWSLDATARPGLEDMLFFVFHRRGEVDLDELLTDTSLRRAFVGVLKSGRSWTGRSGRIRQCADA